jgi:hypothetical protein
MPKTLHEDLKYVSLNENILTTLHKATVNTTISKLQFPRYKLCGVPVG